jgi:Ca2+-binding EF-hand superfamily protein
VSDKEVELLFTYLDRRELGRITLDDFVNEMMVY